MSNADNRVTLKVRGKLFAAVKKHREITGIPIGTFVDDAILEKLSALPDDMKKKLGIKSVKK